MKNLYFVLFVTLLVSLSSCKKELDSNGEVDIPEGYSLVWNDEFNESEIDLSKWSYELGDGTDYGLPVGWGNDEKQIYTDDAANSGIVDEGDDSVLAITAMEDGNGAFSSAKLTTQSLMSMRFGRLEVRAKMPKGQGIWPAIWMLGDNVDQISWPGCGEIDLTEVLGHQPATLNTTLHFTNAEKKHGEIQNVHDLNTGDFSSQFHEFAMEWTPEALEFSLDGAYLSKVPIEEDMKEFLRSFYLILNVAVGGNWPGDPDETTVFPQSMLVDYVRIFSKDGMEIPDAPILDIDEETVGQNIEPNIADNAILEGFTDLGGLTVVAYGGGGEPHISTSETALDGDLSLLFDFPGGSWGGGYIEMLEAKDMSAYTHVNFSLQFPSALVNCEIKLESTATNAAVYLVDYEGVSSNDGFLDFSIPLSDFVGLDLSSLTIPFAIWNPQDAQEEFVAAQVLIDKLYFSK